MSEARIFALADLHCRHVQQDWVFEREQAAHIADFWARFQAENPACFNGRVYLQHHWRIEAGRYLADCFETGFAAFMAWRDLGFPGPPVRNGFAMAALRAGDGAFLLGEMSAATANPGKIYFAAGTPDPDDRLADGTIDLAGSVLRELAEETGLKSDEVQVGAGWTCVDLPPRVAFMRAVTIDLPAMEARALMLTRMASLPEQELVDIHIVRGPADIDEARMPPFQVAFLKSVFSQG
jgi:8-oxo-dGTP pyrophosphatase MutT (NUDIX family)